jgi:hypothetical protein
MSQINQTQGSGKTASDSEWPPRAAGKCSSQNAPCRPQPTDIVLTVSVKTFSDRAATSYGSEGLSSQA